MAPVLTSHFSYADYGKSQEAYISGRIVKVGTGPEDPPYSCRFAGIPDGFINPANGQFAFTFDDGAIRGQFASADAFTADLFGLTGRKDDGSVCGPDDHESLQFAVESYG